MDKPWIVVDVTTRREVARYATEEEAKRRCLENPTEWLVRHVSE